MKLIKRMIMTGAMAIAAPIALSAPVMAEDFPLVAGD